MTLNNCSGNKNIDPFVLEVTFIPTPIYTNPGYIFAHLGGGGRLKFISDKKKPLNSDSGCSSDYRGKLNFTPN